LITITWFDGGTNSGETWSELEAAVRAAQWSEYKSNDDFRLDMRHRCKVWSGVRPSLARATSETFLRALETAGLCRIDTDDDETTEPHTGNEESNA
jgi:hypothetical protein